MAKAEELNFKAKVLAVLNKSKEEFVAEQIEDQIEDFTIETRAQISIIESSDIPAQKVKVTRAKRSVIKAKKNLENAYLDIQGRTFESYLSNIASREVDLNAYNDILEALAEESKEMKESLSRFKDILNRLES